MTPLNLVDFWAYFASDPLPPHRVNPAAKAGGAGLGVVLAGRESRRSLPLPLLADVVQTAFGLLDGPPVYLLGSRTEQPAARRLLRLLPIKIQEKVEDLSGKTDWAALVQALQGLDILLTPDTGVMHLAAHLGVPVWAFFLSSAWCHETGPYGEGHTVWQAVRDCSPCIETGPCFCDTACLNAFQGRALLRSMAAAAGARGLARHPELPPGLQCWRSGLDALGGVFSLLAGEDSLSARRTRTRELLAERIGLSAGPETPVETEMDSRLHSWLYSDSDWMLPPGRYC